MAIGDDIVNFFGGGPSGDEKKKFEQMELEQRIAYANTILGLDKQYQGPAADRIKYAQQYAPHIAALQEMAKYPADQRQALLTKLNTELVANGQQPVDMLTLHNIGSAYQDNQQQLEKDLTYHNETYKPDEVNFMGGYAVEDYTPEKLTAMGEAGIVDANLDKYGVPTYDEATKYDDPTLQDPSEAAKARLDAQGLDAQREALRGYSDIYNKGGLTAIDRANYDTQRREVEQEERAQREAIMADMAQRGMTNSGLNVGAQLNKAQAGADRLNAAQLQIAAQALARKDNALSNLTSSGGSLSRDVYNSQLETGREQDAISKFNTLSMQDVEKQRRDQQDAIAKQQRDAQDALNSYQRDVLNRDIDRINATSLTNTTNANDAAKWKADQLTDANEYIAKAKQLIEEQNTIANTNANQQNASWNNTTANNNVASAYNQIANLNQQIATKGALGIEQANAVNNIVAGLPTADPAAALHNFTMFMQDPAEGKEIVKTVGSVTGGISSMGGGAAMAAI